MTPGAAEMSCYLPQNLTYTAMSFNSDNMVKAISLVPHPAHVSKETQ
jgi:hypothetical protein